MNAYSHDEIESILDRYGDMVYRTAFIQTKSRDNADDIYQEVCIRLVKQKKRLESEEHIRAWLIRVTLSCCRDLWKSAWWQKVTFGEPEEGCMSDVEEEGGGWVTKCVQCLPEKYRIMIHLYYYEEYSQKEIAGILGLKENTVASRLSRGRSRLKKLLEQEGERYGFSKCSSQ